VKTPTAGAGFVGPMLASPPEALCADSEKSLCPGICCRFRAMTRASRVRGASRYFSIRVSCARLSRAHPDEVNGACRRRSHRVVGVGGVGDGAVEGDGAGAGSDVAASGGGDRDARRDGGLRCHGPEQGERQAERQGAAAHGAWRGHNRGGGRR